MMRQRPVHIPERLVIADVIRSLFGLLMIPLGVVILVRTLSIAVTAPGLLTGAAFVAFGVHRLWTAWNGFRLYLQKRENAR